MSDTLEQLFAQSVGTFGQAMEAVAKDDHGHFTPEYRAWHAARMAGPNLDATADEFVAGVKAIEDNPMLPADHKAAMIAQNKALYEAEEARRVGEFQAGNAAAKAALHESYASKVVVAADTSRSLIRDEVAQVVAAIPRGGTLTRAIQQLIESDPDRYAAEISSAWGANLFRAHGEAENHGPIARHGLALLPDTTKSARARAALDAMQASRIEGMARAMTAGPRAKVEAALAPKKPEPGVYRMDTIRAPRS